MGNFSSSQPSGQNHLPSDLGKANASSIPDLVAHLHNDLRQRLAGGGANAVEEFLQLHIELERNLDLLLRVVTDELDATHNNLSPAEREALLDRYRAYAQESQQNGTTFLGQDSLHSQVETPLRGFLDTESSKKLASVSAQALSAIPGYEILAELGRGGMGVVCKARHLSLDRVVAVKMILGGRAGADDLARFRLEAEAIAQLQHPNIVQIFEVGEHEGRLFFTMECCAEGSLAQKLSSTPLSAKEAAHLLETLALAVQTAHERQIIHRDLKPANILLAEGGVPKIADFGLAKRLDGAAGQTQTGVIMGTPSYMAPEQAEARTHAIGPPADIYALGAILYDVLTGRPPFKAASLHETIQQVVNQDPVPPRMLQPTVPGELETICLKCLEKKPDRRYASAQLLADDLQRYLAGKPILARPAGRVERVTKWARRHPSLTAFIITLLLGIIGTAVGGIRAFEAERDNANLKLQAERQRYADAEAIREAERKAEAAQQARQIENTQLAIKLALQRGGSREVIDLFDRAVASGLPVTPEMRINKVRALIATGNSQAALKELQQIEEASLPPELLGQYELLHGALLVGRDDKTATKWLRKATAADRNLPRAELEYGLGLLAETVPESLKHFETAIALDPTHIDARSMACLTYFALGRFADVIRLGEESRAFSPKHPNFLLMLAFGYSGRDDLKNARKCLEQLRPEIADPDTFNLVKAFVEDIFPTIRKRASRALSGEPFTLADNISQSILIAKHMGKLDVSEWEQKIEVRLPPALRRGMEFQVIELAELFKRNGAGAAILALIGFKHKGKSVFDFDDPAGEAIARERMKLFPDGTLKFLFAERKSDLAGWSGTGKAEMSKKYGKNKEQLFFDAGVAYEDAARTPSLMGVEAGAMDHAIVSYLMAGFGEPGRPKHPEFVRKAAQLVRERRSMPDPIQHATWPIHVSAMRDAGELGHALFLLDELRRLRPADDQRNLREQVMKLVNEAPKADPEKGGGGSPKVGK